MFFPVLILAVPATVKQVITDALIDNMEAHGPFVVVDCSSLVGPLIKPAFWLCQRRFHRGAQLETRSARAANGGTAFFDEIGELPLEMQVKLLRVLQEKEFRAVGSLAQRSSSFRVVAATNRDLAAEVEEGKFRRDLDHRSDSCACALRPCGNVGATFPP